MFNKFRIGAAGVALVAAMGMAGSANAATANASATAQILEALTLDVQSGSTLDFGVIAPNGAGTVVVDAATGAANCSAALICTGTPSSVGFDVGGGANQNVGITLPTGAVTLNRVGGGASMTIDTFTDDAGGSVTLDGSGDASFNVGATLTVGAAQMAGTYNGNFDVSVAYQ
jgi:hypothetical protein